MFRVTLVVLTRFGLLSAAVVVGSAGAVPKPPPKFWTVSRCEQVFRARDHWVPNAEGYVFHLGLTICAGTGGSRACAWTSDHRSRLYSQFTVFTRSRYIGGVVRSFALATRAGHGLVRIGPAGDQYLRWPAEFYVSPASVRLLAPKSTPARFRAIVAPLAAHLTRQETATSCTSG